MTAQEIRRKQGGIDHDAAHLLGLAADVVLRGWTTGVNARNDRGQQCDPCSEDAVCWCAYGALIRGAWRFGLITGYGPRLHVNGTAEECQHKLAVFCCAEDAIRDITGYGAQTWNDQMGQTQENVARTMRNAADRLREAIG